MNLILTRTGNVRLDGHALNSHKQKILTKKAQTKTRSNEYKQ